MMRAASADRHAAAASVRSASITSPDACLPPLSEIERYRRHSDWPGISRTTAAVDAGRAGRGRVPVPVFGAAMAGVFVAVPDDQHALP